MTACPLDGSVRVVEVRELDAVWWRCTWCRQVSEERIETEPKGEA